MICLVALSLALRGPNALLAAWVQTAAALSLAAFLPRLSLLKTGSQGRGLLTVFGFGAGRLLTNSVAIWVLFALAVGGLTLA